MTAKYVGLTLGPVVVGGQSGPETHMGTLVEDFQEADHAVLAELAAAAGGE